MVSRYLLRRSLNRAAQKVPAIFSAYMYATLGPKRRHRLVSSRSTLCIEGPPRCANSAALRLINQANPELRGRVATHLHSPTQIVFAAHHDIPYLLMLRDPAESVVSHCALLAQLGQVHPRHDGDRRRLLLSALFDYAGFAQIALDHLSHVVFFEDFISDQTVVISRLNSLYDLGIKGTDQVVVQDTHVHVLPSEERQAIKQTFDRVARSDDGIANRMHTLSEQYRKLQRSA